MFALRRRKNVQADQAIGEACCVARLPVVGLWNGSPYMVLRFLLSAIRCTYLHLGVPVVSRWRVDMHSYMRYRMSMSMQYRRGGHSTNRECAWASPPMHSACDQAPAKLSWYQEDKC